MSRSSSFHGQLVSRCTLQVGLSYLDLKITCLDSLDRNRLSGNRDSSINLGRYLSSKVLKILRFLRSVILFLQSFWLRGAGFVEPESIWLDERIGMLSSLVMYGFSSFHYQSCFAWYQLILPSNRSGVLKIWLAWGNPVGQRSVITNHLSLYLNLLHQHFGYRNYFSSCKSRHSSCFF